jgi:hypothetical protein
MTSDSGYMSSDWYVTHNTLLAILKHSRVLAASSTVLWNSRVLFAFRGISSPSTMDRIIFLLYCRVGFDVAKERVEVVYAMSSFRGLATSSEICACSNFLITHHQRHLTHHGFVTYGSPILTLPCCTQGPSTPLGTGTRMEGQERGWG